MRVLDTLKIQIYRIPSFKARWMSCKANRLNLMRFYFVVAYKKFSYLYILYNDWELYAEIYDDMARLGFIFERGFSD
jgi:hypothetical protein